MPPKSVTINTLRVWLTCVSFAVLYGAFAVYVHYEKEIDRANERRLSSYHLVEQLRRSSDDLTRMVRTYVVTGDPRFKKYFQDILDIRNGTIPRPDGYDKVYWDRVIVGELPSPQENGKGVPLLDLMHQQGFTDDEFNKLAEAKSNSDELSVMEFEAMSLVDPSRSVTEADKAQAARLLFGEKYHQAKNKISSPINDVLVMVDQRTNAEVDQAVHIAFLLRLLFLVISLGALINLWRIHKALSKTLGGTADDVLSHITKIAQGDLTTVITPEADSEGSILASLIQMQGMLRAHEEERQKKTLLILESEARLKALFDTHAISIVVIDDLGIIQKFNPASEILFGYASAEPNAMPLACCTR